MWLLFLLAVTGPDEWDSVEDIPREYVLLIEQGNEQRAARAEQLEKKIQVLGIQWRKMRTSAINPRQEEEMARNRADYVFKSAKARRKFVDQTMDEIKAVQAQVQDMQNPAKLLVPLLSVEPHVESAGVFQDAVKVLQVIDDDEMIVTYHGIDIWVKNTPTKGLVDDVSIEVEEPIFIDGTKSYQAASGAQRTIFTAHCLEVGNARKAFDVILKARFVAPGK